jgi:hypothetical protein
MLKQTQEFPRTVQAPRETKIEMGNPDGQQYPRNRVREERPQTSYFEGGPYIRASMPRLPAED